MSLHSDNDPHSEDGFVLIEILCALLIIGIASVAFLQLASQSSARTFEAQSTIAANDLSQTLMEVECQKRFADIRDATGQSADGKYEWLVSVSPLAGYASPNNEQPTLAQIDVEIYITSNTDKPLRKLSHIHAYGHGS